MEKKNSDTELVFAKRLDQIMRASKVSNAELADALYVAETTISGYRNGRRSPDLYTVRKICEELLVSADYLLGLSDNPFL